MEQKQKLRLDALELSDRMRSYRPRPTDRVVPRGSTTHLQRRMGMDVWEPINIASANLVKANQQADNAKKTLFTNKPSSQVVSANRQSGQDASNRLAVSGVSEQLQSPTGVDTFSNSRDQQTKVHRPKRLTMLQRIKLPKSNYLLYGMAVVIFLIGLAVTFRSYKIDSKIAQTVSAQATDTSGNFDDVDENKPSDADVGAYSVAPDLPKIVTIPKLNAKGRVRQMTIGKDGLLESPKNIYDAGWFNQSAKPGSQGGAVLLDGHVSGPTQKGVFYKLESLKKDDIVTIERGDGQKIDYKVVRVEVKKATDVDMAQMLLPVTQGSHGLNLITCTGKFNSSSKTYEDRALVFTQVSRIY